MQSPPRIRPDGFTLLEVLVALVVLSIGLLGIGKLVLFSARGNDSAYLRSQATALAYTILDDMRANRDQAQQGSYNVGTGPYAGPGANCITAQCTPGTLADWDLAQWKTKMSTALGPTGDGTTNTVAVTDPVSGSVRYLATITVQWNDAVAQQTFGAANNTAIITLETIL